MKVRRRGPEIGGAPKGTAVRQVVIGRGIRLYQGGTGYKTETSYPPSAALLAKEAANVVVFAFAALPEEAAVASLSAS